jgi:ribokinase
VIDPRTPARVLVVGSLNTDLTVTVPALPRPGQTVTGGDLRRSPGGKGANQAAALARLGGRTELLGLVGDDAEGDRLRREAEAHGVTTTDLGSASGTPTGTALITVDARGENTVTVSPGANGALRPAHVRRAAAAFERADAVLLQLEIPLDTALAAVRAAAGAGALVVLNAAPVPPAGADDPLVRELLASTGVLVVNQGEAEALLGVPAGDDPVASAEELRTLGPTETVVTLGARGAAWAEPGGAGTLPAFAVRPVDTVGAGDAFCAALALARVEGLPLREAVRTGCAAGALAATRDGAQQALPGRDEVGALLTRSGETPGDSGQDGARA